MGSEPRYGCRTENPEVLRCGYQRRPERPCNSSARDGTESIGLIPCLSMPFEGPLHQYNRFGRVNVRIAHKPGNTMITFVTPSIRTSYLDIDSQPPLRYCAIVRTSLPSLRRESPVSIRCLALALGPVAHDDQQVSSTTQHGLTGRELSYPVTGKVWHEERSPWLRCLCQSFVPPVGRVRGLRGFLFSSVVQGSTLEGSSVLRARAPEL
jgi:hypothetical protein